MVFQTEDGEEGSGEYTKDSPCTQGKGHIPLCDPLTTGSKRKPEPSFRHLRGDLNAGRLDSLR